MGHTRKQWEDRVRAALGDAGVLQLVPATSMPSAIESALAEYAGDFPREQGETFAGDGSAYDFDLNDGGDAHDDWVDRWSWLIRVEYPTGEREPSYVETRRFTVAPGSTTLRCILDTPATGESLRAWWATPWPHPDDTAGTDLISDLHFPAVTALAASRVARETALTFARRQSQSVAGTMFERDAEPLFTAAKALREEYRNVVLGSPTGGSGAGDEPAMSVERVDVFPGAIFHRH